MSIPLMAHSVRIQKWRPICAARAAAVSAVRGSTAMLRYLSVSNNDPGDVHALDGVVRPSRDPHTQKYRFGDVHIFSQGIDPQPLERAIPGSQSFGTGFVAAMLHDATVAVPAPPDTEAYDKFLKERATLRRFLQYAPFDAISLSLDDGLIASLASAGETLLAMERLFAIQRDGGEATQVDAWSLQIAWRFREDAMIADPVRTALIDAIDTNVASVDGLAEIAVERWGSSQAGDLANDAEAFLTLSVPKLILSMLYHQGWVPEGGQTPILLRANHAGDCYMFLLLDLQRLDGDLSTYQAGARRLFQNDPQAVSAPDGAVSVSFTDLKQRIALYSGHSAYI